MISEFERVTMNAQQERAVVLGGMIADIFIWIGKIPGRCAKLLESPTSDLSSASSTEEVRAYAARIARTDPGFASDLFAAANRADSV